MLLTRRKQTGNALIGYLFIGYAFFTLALTFVLSHSRSIQVTHGTVSTAETIPQATSRNTHFAVEPTALHRQVAKQAAPPKTAHKIKAAFAERPDFGAMKDVKTKKETFFLYLLPAIESENKRMASAQKQLLEMQTLAGQSLSSQQQKILAQWGKDYRIDLDASAATQIAQLLVRMDKIPASMVLAQGAMESAWGTSRFARLANNYFGQWCFSKGCGIVPSQRNAGAGHEVATFSNAQTAVTAYFKNINRHPAYQRVRDERSALRKAGKGLDSLAMVRGLYKYSARGHAYIEELQSMIRYNKIKRFD